MHRVGLRTLVLRFSPIGILLSIAVGTASAGTVSCNSTVTISTDTTLADDYVQTSVTSAPCITVTNGANVDLNGHTVTRTVEQDYSSSAGIECVTTGSLITDTASTKGYIAGTFYRGVKNCEDVVGITIKTIPGNYYPLGPVIGISNSFVVAKANNIINNVVANGDGVGIDVDMLSSTSLIENNYIKAINGITVVGTPSGSGPYVRYNIMEVNYSCASVYDKVRLQKNLCFDRADQTYSCFSFSGVGGATSSDNQCDCSTQCKITPIFTLPWF